MGFHPLRWLVDQIPASGRDGAPGLVRQHDPPDHARPCSKASQLALLAVLLGIAGGPGRADPAAADWRVVGTLPPGVEGAMQLVVVPESRRRERRYFQALGQELCRDQRQCTVLFWTDAALVPLPEAMAISNASRAAIVAQYTVVPNAPAPLLQLPCAFYSNPTLGRTMSCLDYAATAN